MINSPCDSNTIKDLVCIWLRVCHSSNELLHIVLSLIDLCCVMITNFVRHKSVPNTKTMFFFQVSTDMIRQRRSSGISMQTACDESKVID